MRARRSLEREFFIANLLVRIHFIIVMIRWIGLAPFPFPGSLTSTFLKQDFGPRRAWLACAWRGGCWCGGGGP